MNTFTSNFDFSRLNSAEFKEDSVREVIISPILYEIGYSDSGENKITRSKALVHPFLTIGSRRRKLKIIPDYLLQVHDKYVWVLDAKSPSEEIETGDNVEQVYSYAVHKEIRVKLFALCNGWKFVLFSTEEESVPVLSVPIPEIESYWRDLKWRLSPEAFQKKPETQHRENPTGLKLAESGFDHTVEKEIGVLWSNLLNEPEYSEIVRFKGQLLAETKTEDANGPRWYELYRLANGRYVAYMSYNHRFDYGGASLTGVNAWGEVGPPLTLEELQEQFPALAKEAGLVRVREFNPDNL